MAVLVDLFTDHFADKHLPVFDLDNDTFSGISTLEATTGEGLIVINLIQRSTLEEKLEVLELGIMTAIVSSELTKKEKAWRNNYVEIALD